MRELSLLLLELLRNSLEAEAGMVCVRVREEGRRLCWRVADDGRGMSRACCRRALDPFQTQRTTRAVGLGLALLDMWARRCGGFVRLASRRGQGTLVAAAFERGHPDLPVWGDVPGTLWTLAATLPDVRFVYTHTLDGRRWRWDSQQAAQDLLAVREDLEEGWNWLRRRQKDENVGRTEPSA